MRKQKLNRIDLNKVLGDEAASTAAAALRDGIGSKINYGGKKVWNRIDRYPHMRIEWRIEDDKIIYSFYHPEGPDPSFKHDDPNAVRIDERGNEVVAVEHGRPIGLGDAFGAILPKVCDYLFEELGYTFGYVDETCSWRVEVPGIAHQLTMRKRYTDDFFEILAANYTTPN